MLQLTRPLRTALAVATTGALATTLVVASAATATTTAPQTTTPDTAPAAITAATAAARGLRLVAGADTVQAWAYDGQVYLEPAVWLASYGQGLEVWMKRARYADPVTLTKTVIRGQQRTTTTAPASIVDGMNGFKDGLTMTVRTPRGRVLSTTTQALCPGGWQRQRVDPSGPSESTYPTWCGGAWFSKATVAGIESGWAVQPNAYLDFRTRRSTLTLTTSISRPVARFLGIPAGARTVTQDVEVVDECDEDCRATTRATARRTGRGVAPGVPAGERHVMNAADTRVAHARPSALRGAPARDTLPDLVSVPAWQISTEVDEEGTDRLNFAANEWNAGPAPMVVEGFRRGTAPIMDGYQMFYRDGEEVGSLRTGTMEFHNAPEHHHWHFLDFAKYELVRTDGSLVTTSGKQSWCLAPTDAVDLSIPTAVWEPESTGLESSCGEESALWLRETMPVGWGDTYGQYQTQAFDLTGVPNGRYRIKVTVNPNGNLYERTRSNNVSLRTVVIGGTAGDRTVRVPPYQGVDTETGWDDGEG